MNKLVFGHDPEQHIVGLAMKGSDRMTVYSRTDGVVTERDEPLRPWAILSDEAIAWADKNLARLPRRRMEGGLHFRNLVSFDDWWHFMSVRKKLKATEIEWPIYAPPSATTQYLMLTGKTFFKGMEEADLVRMQIDIETYSQRYGFPQSDREEDTITMISLTDNRGNEKVLCLEHPKATIRGKVEYCSTEAEMLRALVREIHRLDPDVLELHNGLGYDLPYIEARCDLRGVTFGIGRDGKPPRSYEATKKFAERDINYTRYEVGGRSILDTMFLVMAHDVFARDMPNHTLKGAAKHFGIASETRVYVDGQDIHRTWEEEPDRLIEYALDDTRETAGLSRKLGGAAFYLSQMVPMTLQDVHLGGTATMIENLIVRGYMARNHSIPRPSEGRQTVGGYTRAYMSGRFKHLVYADVNSLYPAIMLNEEGCLSSKDVLGLSRDILSSITDLRLSTKDAAKALERDGKDNSLLKSREQSFKVVINSFYGAQGFLFFAFNDFAAADRVATIGQAILHEMMEHIHELGGSVIEADTDGVLFVAPEEIETDLEAQAEMVKEVERRMSRTYVGIGLDGLYETMLSYRAKNYALVDYNGKPKLKGGAFKNRGLESYFRSYMIRQINHLLAGDTLALWHEHEKAKTAIYTGSVPMTELAVKRTLKMGIAEYLQKREDGNNAIAQYDLALRVAERTGRDVEKGDVITYYIAGEKSGSTVRAFEDAELIEDYDNDLNVKYYLRRLHAIAERFECFFLPEDFGTLFVKPPRNVPSRPYLVEMYDPANAPTNPIAIDNRFIAND